MAYLPTIEEVDESTKSAPSPRSSLTPNQKTTRSTGFMYDYSRGSPSLKRTHSGGGETLSEGSDVQKQHFVTHSMEGKVTLMEDCFGLYKINEQTPIKVLRFTWRSNDNVVVQVITYGARIVSMKYPDKNGTCADIVLGFHDLSGYLYYDQYYIGATIGAVTDKIKNARFDLNGKHIKVTENDGEHYCNGGAYGLDQIIWNSCVIKNKVVLSHVIPHKHEGLPGPVMVKVTYELNARNEFHIDMEANTARPTIINLSNLCYFNLGGHNGGCEELKKHSVTINCNCYTLMDDDDLPTGKIMNVVHTKYDFTKPKLLRNCLDIEPNSGYYQNLCVNRASTQGNCLIARIVHTTNGRELEIYSNQYGVKFNTANEFSLGVLSPPSSEQKSLVDVTESIFIMLDQVFRMMETLELFDDSNFNRVHGMLVQIRKMRAQKELEESQNYGRSTSFENPDFCIFNFLQALQQSAYAVRDVIPHNIQDVRTWSELKIIIKDMRDKYIELDTVSADERLSELMNERTATEEDLALQRSGRENNSIAENAVIEGGSLTEEKSSHNTHKVLSEKYIAAQKLLSQSHLNEMTSEGTPSKIHADSSVLKNNRSNANVNSNCVNEIPNSYKDGRVHGKLNAIYVKHGAMAFQTQNYPDAIHHSNFPSPILRPGETYKHSIIYKFSTERNNLARLRKKQNR